MDIRAVSQQSIYISSCTPKEEDKSWGGQACSWTKSLYKYIRYNMLRKNPGARFFVLDLSESSRIFRWQDHRFGRSVAGWQRLQTAPCRRAVASLEQVMNGRPLSAPRPSNWALGAATLCFAAALGLASLLAWHTLAGRPPVVGCGGAVDCGTVTNTHWAYWGPVPVVLPAVVLYLTVLGALCALAPLRAARHFRREQAVWVGLSALSLVALGAAGWFAAVQAFVLRRFCPFCLATHLCASLGSLLILRLASGNLPAGGRSWWRLPLAVATGVLALLVGGQFVLPSFTLSAPAPTNPATLPASVRSLALPDSDLVLADGRVHLDAAAYPVLAGSSAPTRVVAVLFDYTCEACRTSHALLTATVGRHGPGCALVLVPTPLDPACNPAVERLRPEHVNACLYARYALAVWKAAPEKFVAYDAWLMAGSSLEPPPIDEARRQAELIVGAETLRRALEAPALDQALHRAGKIYQALDAGEIPKLLLPHAVLSGRLGSPQQLDQALEKP